MVDSIEDIARRLESDAPVVTGRLRWAIAIVALLAVVGFLLIGANGPANPSLATQRTRQPIPGFSETGFSISSPAATMARLCALLADRDELRIQGLRGQQDLRGYDGMLFVFGADTDGSFVMGGVDVALEIAWFDSQGTLVSTALMAPCPGQPDSACPHAPSRPLPLRARDGRRRHPTPRHRARIEAHSRRRLRLSALGAESPLVSVTGPGHSGPR